MQSQTVHRNNLLHQRWPDNNGPGRWLLSCQRRQPVEEWHDHTGLRLPIGRQQPVQEQWQCDEHQQPGICERQHGDGLMFP